MNHIYRLKSNSLRKRGGAGGGGRGKRTIAQLEQLGPITLIGSTSRGTSWLVEGRGMVAGFNMLIYIRNVLLNSYRRFLGIMHLKHFL
jgi:hypothetical protein